MNSTKKINLVCPFLLKCVYNFLRHSVQSLLIKQKHEISKMKNQGLWKLLHLIQATATRPTPDFPSFWHNETQIQKLSPATFYSLHTSGFKPNLINGKTAHNSEVCVTSLSQLYRLFCWLFNNALSTEY